MEEMLREYLPILVFLAIAIGLGLVLILAAAVIAVRNLIQKKYRPMNVALTHLMMRG